MATNRLVFKPGHISRVQEKMTLQIPDRYKKFQGIEEVDEYEIDSEGNVVEQYHGPTIEEIEAELERYRKETEEEIRRTLEEAHEKARTIEEQGKTVAFQLNQDAHERAKKDLEKARQDAEQIIERSKMEVERMVKEAEMRVAEIEHEAYQKGYDAGREVGFKKGQSEVRRLIDRLGMIVGQAIDVREEIIAASEKQMVDMILMVARKVIKDEVVERKEVVLNNIREALRRIKDRDRVNIRVNFADLELTTAHKDELIKMMESLRKVNIYEDSRVDRGGCIIETDVGSIDARISTQLKEIEEAIRNAEPM
ncbi:MAG: flagellar assembly protein FliH [Leptonema illini]|jgi:flagellar assembly protein FliH|uniref:Flagellar assembly protein FliH n=2 Tax=Leptonema illini TaxID=183 RepID=H2CG65_9LEPT|nr:flagellar assembly protein FliH [Leptonema illini]EHQ05746.1 Flagellar assembly protein FliH/Type III secretion system HrpE [Leptonema illini DSM 21528]KAB2934046.1 MAG: flagellar assembly protein FliH [Leptonema illini]PKL34226.1 MAG: flagellar assembly protein FliH [Spirochaetae bacterium HGW-Spirochaetae-10]